MGFGDVFSAFGITIGLAHAHPTFALAIVFPFTGIVGRFTFPFALTIIHTVTLALGHFSPGHRIVGMGTSAGDEQSGKRGTE